MKVEKCGLDTIEHWIRPALPSVITIPIISKGKPFVIYVSSLVSEEDVNDNFKGASESLLELQNIAKEIANKLEAKPKHLHPFFENNS